MAMRWDVDEFDGNGKLVLLYRFQRILDEGVIKKGDKVLDVGGWGKLEYRLSQEGCAVDMLNIDKAECDRVRAKYGNAFNIINADIRHADIESETYDVVACFETLEHIMEDRERAINEMMRVLKPGGRIVGTIPIPGRCHPSDDKSVVFISPAELRKILLEYSLVVKIEETGSVNIGDKPCSWYFLAKKDRI